ncbi:MULTISPECIES: NUDIX domain-containing protein [Paenibacillus]|uniref:NUDIX hydrolase n=1 Tax=Paenibacillus illinoisensis TaxID=59845 RepID=A0A2W0C220_9BACL|nr:MULTISPECIES: NUDIX domain-containing protein [Paenibacillus]MBM6383456.1 NUDIX domain-containing protein [Paenibacillus sp.]PAD32955.1 DNA mismatch repair protein MutT [Paenibacillus sp. 7523-1]PYY25744.1 NUDIX hydrolase [Paenibacillus illinoisensis]
MERRIRNSVKALIIEDRKMLAIKIDDDGDAFYILPGGSQSAGETLTEAVKREVAEEIGVEIIPNSLEFVIEGVYGEAFHRVDFVFLCEYKGLTDHLFFQSDGHQVRYEWLDIDNLIGQPLYPSKLRKQIQQLFNGEKTEMYLGNEEPGNPSM